MVKYYQFTRKCHKWTKKITFYFLQMAIYNAFALYKQYSLGEKKMRLLDFQSCLIDALLDFELKDWPVTGDNIPHAPDLTTEDDPDEGTSSGSVRVPPTAGVKRQLFANAASAGDTSPFSSDDEEEQNEMQSYIRKKRQRVVDDPRRMKKHLRHSVFILQKRKRCRVCVRVGKRRDTRYSCKECNVALCIKECFNIYHSKVKYWRR